MKPSYDLNVLLKDCKFGISRVMVSRGAIETARIDFNLNTNEQVLQFIASGGLELPSFINSDLWRNNPDQSYQIMVDSYEFFSGEKYGYLAFFQAKNKRWIIKSFKKNINHDPRNFTMRDSLTKFKEISSAGGSDD